MKMWSLMVKKTHTHSKWPSMQNVSEIWIFMQNFQPILPFQSDYGVIELRPHRLHTPPPRITFFHLIARSGDEASLLHSLDRMVSFTGKKELHSV